MRPPVCIICSKKLDEENGGLIYFKKKESDLKWDKKNEDPHFVGHPPYADWFCKEHYGLALERQGLTIGEAIKEIKALD